MSKNCMYFSYFKVTFFLSIAFFSLFQHAIGQSIFQEYKNVEDWKKALEIDDSKNNLKARQAKYSAALALNSLGPNMAEGHGQLLKLLKSNNTYVRQYAAFALSNFKYSPNVDIPALISLFKDKEKIVRQTACISVMRYGKAAIQYLLAPVANYKDKLSEDGPEDQSQIRITNSNLYAMIALRNLGEEKVVQKISKRFDIPFDVKKAIVFPYGYEFQPYFNGSVWEYNKTPSKIQMDSVPYISPVNITSQDEFCFRSNDKLEDDKSIYTAGSLTLQIDSLLQSSYNIEQNQNTIFLILANNEYLIPKYKYLFSLQIDKMQPTYINPYFLMALYNSGKTGRDFVPQLMAILNRYKDDRFELGFEKPLLYKIAGNILSGSVSKIRPTWKFCNFSKSFLYDDEDIYTIVRAEILKPLLFYYYNLHGLTTDEIIKSQTHRIHYGISNETAEAVKAGFKLMPEEADIDSMMIGDKMVKSYISYGLAADDNLKCIALDYCRFLDKINFPLTEFTNENILVQRFFFNLTLIRPISLKYIDNLRSRFMLNNFLIVFFNSEYINIFEKGLGGLGGQVLGKAESSPLPQLQWPPPPASDRILFSNGNYFKNIKKMGRIYELLKTTLSDSAKIPGNYRRVFAVPEGFAVITHIEQTNKKGEPLPEKTRWCKEVGKEPGWGGYFSSLLFGNEGYFQSLVFVVCPDKNFKDNGAGISDATGFENMYHEGAMDLSETMSQSPADNANMNLLVYKFIKKNGGVIKVIKSSENTISSENDLRILKIKKGLSN